MPQIRLSEQVKKVIDHIKKRNGHSSHDSVIRSLHYFDGSIHDLIGDMISCV